MSLRLRSGTEVKTPRAMTSRSILANHSSTWLSHEEEVGEECDELRRGMPGRGLAEDLAGLGAEGGVQGPGAVAVILEAVPRGAPRGEGRTGALRSRA